MKTVNELKIEIETLYQRLSALDGVLGDVSNGVGANGALVWEETAEVFAVLENLIIQSNRTTNQTMAGEVLKAPRIQALIPGLRRFRSSYEYHQERKWARQVSRQTNPIQALTEYPSYKQYQAIIEFEVGLLRRFSQRPLKRVLFIGCGPLPMTAILLAQKFDIQVDCLDIVPEACQLAFTVIQILDLARQVHVCQTDILDFTPLTRYDAIFLAALVGINNREKSQIIDHLSRYMPTGQLLVLRTAYYLARLVYCAVDLAILTDFNLFALPQAPGGIVQSVIIAEKRHSGQQ